MKDKTNLKIMQETVSAIIKQAYLQGKIDGLDEYEKAKEEKFKELKDDRGDDSGKHESN